MRLAASFNPFNIIEDNIHVLWRWRLLSIAIYVIPLLVIPIASLWDYFMYPKALALWSLASLLATTFIPCLPSRKWSMFQPLPITMIIAFATVLVISALASDYQETVYMGQLTVHNGLFTHISCFILFSSAYSLREYRFQIIRHILIASSCCAAIGLIQYVGLHLWEPDGLRVYWTRIHSTIGNANWFSGIVILAAPLAIYGVIERQHWLWKISLLLLVTTLFAAGTRGAYLAFFVIMLTLVWRDIQNKKRITKQLLFVLIIALLGFGISNLKNNYPLKRLISTKTDIQKGFNGDSSAGEHRLFIYKTSLPLISKNGLFGSGPDTFGRVYPQNKINALLQKEHGDFNNPAKSLNMAHNEYLQLAITIGIPGLIIFLILLLYGISRIITNGIDFNSYIGLAILGYSITLLFTDANIGVSSIFWILIALCFPAKMSSDYTEQS